MMAMFKYHGTDHDLESVDHQFALYVLFRNISCYAFCNALQLFNQNLNPQADSSQSIACNSPFGSFIA